MLVLSRKVGQEVVIGDNIRIVVNRVAGSRVSLGIEAPGSVHVVRGELVHPAENSEEGVGASDPEVHLYRTQSPFDLANKLSLAAGLSAPASR
jgi:carbon storage regulator CsrA